MKHYFISNGKLNGGPYKFEELLAKGITADTWVWYAGSDGWNKASGLEEFKNILPPVTEAEYEKKVFTNEIVLEEHDGTIVALLAKEFSILAVLVIILRLLQVI